MYTLPPVTVYGWPPTPTLTVVSPIRLSGPHVPALACASSQGVTLDSVASRPGGIASLTPCNGWGPSSRLIVIVNGLKPPAELLVVPAVREGLNGRFVPGH